MRRKLGSAVLIIFQQKSLFISYSGLKMSDSNKCEFICIKKKRQCKLLAGKGKRYCGEHSNLSDENIQVIVEIRIFAKNLSNKNLRNVFLVLLMGNTVFMLRT